MSSHKGGGLHGQQYPEEKRERFLSPAELRRIGEVLREMEAERVELPSAILAARLLILTGCRLNEIMSLKCSYIDLGVPALRLPDSKTGAKVVHVGQPVVDLLRNAHRIDGNPWVITGTLPGKPLSDLQPFWQRVRARARVKDGIVSTIDSGHYGDGVARRTLSTITARRKRETNGAQPPLTVIPCERLRWGGRTETLPTIKISR